MEETPVETDLPPTKKRRLNPTGENIYILPDGTIKKEIDAIISAQRIWRERAYEPGKGVMYFKGVAQWADRNR